MSETAASAGTLEDFREDVSRQLEDMRRELRQLRQMVTASQLPAPRRYSKEEIDADMEALRSLHKRILDRRGGELLPPVAEDIARAREERTAQILREVIE